MLHTGSQAPEQADHPILPNFSSATGNVRQCTAKFCMAHSTLQYGKTVMLALLQVLHYKLQTFYDPLSETTQMTQYHKDKPFWILLKKT